MDEIYSFETCCRLCAEEQEATILLFSAEAEAMQLQNKLNRYLQIEVVEDDKLPKNICIRCCSKLQMVCDFIETARKSQDILLDRRTAFQQNEHLLCKIKMENESWLDNDTKLNTIEINVDPMTVLQNSEDGGVEMPLSSDNELCDPNESDDVRYLHADVTIKLIKKGETKADLIDGNVSSKPTIIQQQYNNKCKKSYDTELELNSHLWMHDVDINNGSPLEPDCGVQCESDGSVLLNLKDFGDTNLCQICGKVFTTPRNLAIHMANHMSARRPHMCKICGRSYKTYSSLKSHSVSHSSERPFTCNICKKNFKRNQELKYHLNQHTGVKPYKCGLCDQSFASSGDCYAHRTRMHLNWKIERSRVRRHENQPLSNRTPRKPTFKHEIRFECTFCNHTFLRKDNYMYHMYQHTGKKPFQCTFCSEEFVSRKGLCFHYKLKHPGDNCPLGLVSNNALLQ